MLVARHHRSVARHQSLLYCAGPVVASVTAWFRRAVVCVCTLVLLWSLSHHISAGFYMNVKYICGKFQHKAYCEKHSLEQRTKVGQEICLLKTYIDTADNKAR
ncbi:hypothetical protein ACOSP7_004026 [Xanthoceras sorbifolium]